MFLLLGESLLWVSSIIAVLSGIKYFRNYLLNPST
jgi:hypothetical protein